jgi:hypothetical protein
VIRDLGGLQAGILASARRLAPRAGGGVTWRVMLKAGDPAPDFPVGDTTLHRILAKQEAVVFFFPKAFTPG